MPVGITECLEGAGDAVEPDRPGHQGRDVDLAGRDPLQGLVELAGVVGEREPQLDRFACERCGICRSASGSQRSVAKR